MAEPEALSAAIKHMILSKWYDLSDEAIIILDEDFKYIEINKSYVELIGFEREFLIGRLFGVYQTKFVQKSSLKLIKKALRRLPLDQTYEKEIIAMTRYGIRVPIHMTLWHIGVNDQRYYFGIFKDNSSIREDQQKIEHLQNYNHLTNLPNRQFFVRKLSELLLDTYQEIAVVRISIDSYRLLVSSLGQETVDLLICQFVQRISHLNLANLSCFAHFGGDNFAMLFELSDVNLVHNHLDSLMQLCELPFSVNNSTLYVHISVGVSCYPAHGQQMDVLISYAEKALEYVKHQGGDDIYWFKEKLNHNKLIDLQLETELRQAFDESQFVAYYQPKVELSSNKIVGFEALVRWQHPTRGLLAPSEFITAIITHKLSFELFFQMAQKVVSLLAHWQTLGLNAHLCLNADAAEFNQAHFVTCLHDLLAIHHIDPLNIHIEMTESSLMLRHQAIKTQLAALKALGVCLALDDFGTGYASLSYLQEFPFDFIKVDRSFVENIAEKPTQQHIVKAITTLADALDMKIVAEGIEDIQQRQILTELGCQYGQGYLFGKPMTGEQATTLLLEQAKL